MIDEEPKPSKHSERPLRVGVDVGGTFTDVVLVGPNGVFIDKQPSTPEDYGLAIVSGVLAALSKAGESPDRLNELVHGTTVATNAILEHRGARTGLLTTAGFRDLLEIRRMRIPRLYDPLWEKPRPIVERALRLEVSERVEHTGGVLTLLDEESVRVAVSQLAEERVEAIAVSLLHSYVNPSHERRVGEIVREMLPDVYLTLSCDVLPRIREYERTSTTVVNAFIGPLMDRYLGQLEAHLAERGARPHVLIMQSGGGVMTARSARRRPVFVVESGPAAGVIAAARLGTTLGLDDLITLDMGGTTAKASIIERGQIQRTTEYEVGGGMTVGNRLNRGGGYALSVPAIDICEVGAGGGSIATVDPGGALRVGPISAGAEPGPVCYQHGGQRATLTDANVVLGYLSQSALLGGALSIDAPAAAAAIEQDIARPLKIGTIDAAWAIHRVAVATMVRVVRAVSSERGRDPRAFALIAFGGNGALHAALVAADLGIRQIVVPPNPGLFSAWGLLRADVEYHFSRTALARLCDLTGEDLAARFGSLEAEAIRSLVDDGYPTEAGDLVIERHAELRYVGQSFELPVNAGSDPQPVATPLELAESFEAEHIRNYGHGFPNEKVELVNIGIVARPRDGGRRETSLRHAATQAAAHQTELSRRAYFGSDHGWLETRLVGRAAIGDTATPGPLIVEEYDATTLVPPEWSIRRDHDDNLLLERIALESNDEIEVER